MTGSCKKLNRALSLALFLTFTLPVQAATFNVDSLADDKDQTVGDGLCSTASATCTLRAALEEANFTAEEVDVIQLMLGGTITLTEALPVIASGLSIVGLENVENKVDANGGEFPVFEIDGSERDFSVTMTRLTVSGSAVSGLFITAGDATEVNLTSCTISGNGSQSNEGGGIVNSAELKLTDCTVRDNTTNGNGGGIFNSGDLEIVQTTVANNTSDEDGGGISNESGSTLLLERSTISGNESKASGGGIFNAGTAEMENVTISGNTASDDGGGIANAEGELTLTSVTVADNRSEALQGGGISNRDGGTVTLGHTLLARQSATGGDCFDEDPILFPITSEGFNLDTDSTCRLTAATDLSQTNPLIADLAQSDLGTTETHALLLGSPAIDAGELVDPNDIEGSEDQCPDTDQRGRTRPQDGDLDGTEACDIGAYELKPSSRAATSLFSGGGGGGDCFIASAAYGTYLAPEVSTLRQFRDGYMSEHAAGRLIIDLYYRLSPPVADYIAQHDTLRSGVRVLLTPLVYALRFPLLTAGMLLVVLIGVARITRRPELK